MSNLKENDSFVRHETGLRNPMMDGANNRSVNGTTSAMNVLKSLKK